MHRVQALPFRVKARFFGRVLLVGAAGLALVMRQLSVGRPHHPPARVPHPQAEIHIVEGHRERLVHAVHAVIHPGAHQQTGRRYRREVLHRGQPEHIPAAAPLVVLVAVPRVAAQPRDDPRVLDGVIGVVQHCTADAHAGLCHLAHHLGEPFAVENFHIIVEQ